MENLALDLKAKGLTDEKVISDLIEFKKTTPYTQKKRLPCEMYDKINLMCRKYMDRMARFEVDYDFIIDEKKFKNVAVCCLETVLTLRSKVVRNPISPYWRICDYNVNDFVTFTYTDDIEKSRMDFFSKEIPLKNNVQMNIGVFICCEKSYVCFIWNHMCMDGGGFKAFWSDFCKAYTEYVLNDISPLCFSVGSRKYTEVYKDMDAKKKKLAKSQLANISPKDKHVMPFSNNNIEDNVIIVSRRIDKEHFQKALSYCKAIGATANDLLVAAYIHSLAIVSDIKDDESISVSIATDLRRHMKDLNGVGYTNHVSFIHCALDEKGKDFKDTISRVTSKTKELKEDPFIGLHGIPLLNFAYKTMVYMQAEPIVKLFYRNPTLSVSNVGAIDTKAFSLGGNPPFSAFVAGAAKNKPCAVMTALSINGELSVSMCLRGNESDKEILERFFTEYKNTIESI